MQPKCTIRFSVGDVTFDWAKLKQARDNYIRRLNGIYESEALFTRLSRTFVNFSFLCAGGLEKMNVCLVMLFIF